MLEAPDLGHLPQFEQGGEPFGGDVLELKDEGAPRVLTALEALNERRDVVVVAGDEARELAELSVLFVDVQVVDELDPFPLEESLDPLPFRGSFEGLSLVEFSKSLENLVDLQKELGELGEEFPLLLHSGKKLTPRPRAGGYFGASV